MSEMLFATYPSLRDRVVVITDGTTGIGESLVRHFAHGGGANRAMLSSGAMFMKREDILDRLREHESLLRSRGVAHAALFGSRARGDDRPGSDTDILIELDPSAHITVFDYAGLKWDIAALFEGPVDVVSSEALKPRLRQRIPQDAVYAF
jgi:predicted nucleotidyltransferase